MSAWAEAAKPASGSRAAAVWRMRLGRFGKVSTRRSFIMELEDAEDAERNSGVEQKWSSHQLFLYSGTPPLFSSERPQRSPVFLFVVQCKRPCSAARAKRAVRGGCRPVSGVWRLGLTGPVSLLGFGV